LFENRAPGSFAVLVPMLVTAVKINPMYDFCLLIHASSYQSRNGHKEDYH